MLDKIEKLMLYHVIRLSLGLCCRQHGRSASPSNNFLLWHSFVANPFDGFSVMRYVAHNQVIGCRNTLLFYKVCMKSLGSSLK